MFQKIDSKKVAASTTLTLQVGQCGNQIGPELFKLAQETVPLGGCGLVDLAGGNCRAVCIDTEEKVVNLHSLDKNMTCKYRSCNMVTGHFGRGSNWAMGYHMEEKYGYRGETTFISSCMDRVRMEAEKCDCFMSTLMLHSLAGGTGSGLGSRITEEVRDMFPNRYILSAVVAPLTTGENPMQSYNSILCLSHLLASSDQIIFLNNDDFSSKFEKGESKTNNTTVKSGFGFSQINRQFALDLGGVIFPTDSIGASTAEPRNVHGSSIKKRVSVGMEIPELIRSVCPMPGLRITRLDGVHKNKCDNFEKMFTSLGVSYKSSLHSSESSAICPYKCVASVAVLRSSSAGHTGYGSTNNYISMANKLSFLRFVDWNAFPVDIWHSGSGLAGYSNSLAVCSNSSSCVKYLERIWSSGKHKFEHGAYLHWYEKFGCERSDFEDAFVTIGSTVNDYRQAVVD